MLKQLLLVLLATNAFAAEAAETSSAVATAMEAPATGHLIAYAIALTALLVIGTLLFFHRWSRRHIRQ
jgi:hypothetical protein